MRLMTVRELAEYLDIPKKTIYKLLRSDARAGFPAARVGHNWYANLDEVIEWLCRELDVKASLAKQTAQPPIAGLYAAHQMTLGPDERLSLHSLESEDVKLSSSRLVTVKQLAALLRVHPNTIYTYANRGRIPCFRIGGEWRFDTNAVEHWLHEQQYQRKALKKNTREVGF